MLLWTKTNRVWPSIDQPDIVAYTESGEALFSATRPGSAWKRRPTPICVQCLNGTNVRHRREEVTLNYVKSKHFRVIHVDGAYGGFTPGGYIHMTVYSERMAIPRIIVQHLEEDGSLGKEIEEKRESREGVVREMETDLIFNMKEAIAIRDWLNDKIEKIGIKQKEGN